MGTDGSAQQPQRRPWQFFPTDFVLGHPMRLPGEFVDVGNHNGPEADPNAFVCKFRHYVAYLRFMPSRQADRASYLDKNFFSPTTTHVYVRLDSHRSPLQSAHQGPFKVLAKIFKYFKFHMRHGINNVSIDQIKTAHLLSVSSPIVTTARGRVVCPPTKLVVVDYPTPSEGWGHGGRPWSPKSRAALQGLDQRS